MTIGERLVLAYEELYGKVNKDFIADKLGYETGQAVYKVITGERELSFKHLINFKNSTNRSVDWLLTGVEESGPSAVPSDAALTTNEKLFVGRIARHEGITFAAAVRLLVNIGLDEKARELAVSFRELNEDQLTDVLDAFFGTADTSGNNQTSRKRA